MPPRSIALRLGLLTLALVLRPATGFFFGSGGCGCSRPPPACPPPPICAPQPSCSSGCSTGAGGGYVSSYGQAPVYAGGSYYNRPPPIAVPVRVPPVPSVYNTDPPFEPYQTRSAVSTLVGKKQEITTLTTPSTDDDTDFYDETVPILNTKVAEVSDDAKSLLPTDLYKRRFETLKSLRTHKQRQFSVPNTGDAQVISGVCNNERLGRIMSQVIVSDISASKKLVRKVTEHAFEGRRFDVICATGDFSYSIYAEEYCEQTRGAVTCFAFS